MMEHTMTILLIWLIQSSPRRASYMSMIDRLRPRARNVPYQVLKSSSPRYGISSTAFCLSSM